MQAKHIRWKRWGAGAAGTVLIYTAAGCWLLPALIRSELPKFARTQLERQASIGEVSFNPYTLRLEASEIRLAEADGAPLFAVGKLVVELDWRSLVKRAWSVAEIRVSAPEVQLAIAADGSFNIARLMATLNKQPKQESSGMPRLIIGHFALERGKVAMSDRRAGYADTYTPINFELNNLSTLPDENGNYTFSADATRGGKLHWKGASTLNPIAGSGELTLDNVALPGLAVYLKSYVRAAVTDGKLSLRLPYRFSYKDGKFDASLAGAGLAVRDLALVRDGATTPFARLKLFEVSAVGVDLAKRAVNVGGVRVEDGDVAVLRDAAGQVDLANLMAAAPPPPAGTAPTPAPAPAGTAPTPASASAAAARTASVSAPAAGSDAGASVKKSDAGHGGNWTFQFKQIGFDRLAFSVVDETAKPALKVSADKLQLHLKLDGEIAAAGLQLKVADAAFSLADLALASGTQTPFTLAQLGFTDGAVDLAARRASLGRVYAEGGQFDVARDAKGQFTILERLPKFDQGAPVAKAAAPDPARAVSAGAGNDAAGKAPVAAAGKAPMAAAGKKSPVGAPAPAPAAGAWSASVRRVELSKFGAKFDDGSTGIKSTIEDFKLALDGVGSDLKRPVTFDAGLRLREGGQLSAQGKLLPSSGALDADIVVKQLALAPVQPLLAKYVKLRLAGGNINAKGRLQTGAGGAKDPALRYAGSFDVAGLVLNEEDGDLFASWKRVGADKLSLSVTPNLLDIPELRVVEPNAKLIIENDRSLNATRLLVHAPAPAATASSPAAAPSAASSATAAVPSATSLASAPAPAPASNVPAPPAAAVASAAPARPSSSDAAFPVRVRRLRFQDGKLDFADLSLRPQFSAKIYELNGVVTGLSTKGDARSQIELDGRVDEFGLARVRGQLNPFVPADNTDLNVVFKNIDMVSASPYSMKFAGYKIAEGKISLDLQYKVRNGQLEGQNQIVLDNLTLGERIDSPEALKLPLELALAILKDSDGRIELGLPVAGNMNDPQFSYGAVVWKALGNVLGKIVSSPFRALGNLLGVGGAGGDKLGTVDFEPGSAVVLPPEREKLNQVAKLLAKRGQLAVTVPGQYSEAADGAALRTRALRRDIALRVGIKLEAGEEPGPVNFGGRKVRGAVRDLYAERFGAAELEKQKKAAEAGAPLPAGTPAGDATAKAAPADAPEAAPAKLPMFQRLGKLVQGEPLVADPTTFYDKLLARLEQSEPLAPDALSSLGTQRSGAILAALKEAGVNPASVHAKAAEKISTDAGKPVSLKLDLSAQ